MRANTTKPDNLLQMGKDFVFSLVLLPIVIGFFGTMFNLAMRGGGFIDEAHYKMGQAALHDFALIVCTLVFLYLFVLRPIFRR